MKAYKVDQDLALNSSSKNRIFALRYYDVVKTLITFVLPCSKCPEQTNLNLHSE
jgi:hypothetical protein